MSFWFRGLVWGSRPGFAVSVSWVGWLGVGWLCVGFWGWLVGQKIKKKKKQIPKINDADICVFPKYPKYGFAAWFWMVWVLGFGFWGWFFGFFGFLRFEK